VGEEDLEAKILVPSQPLMASFPDTLEAGKKPPIFLAFVRTVRKAVVCALSLFIVFASPAENHRHDSQNYFYTLRFMKKF
jgi:hypothetical protein